MKKLSILFLIPTTFLFSGVSGAGFWSNTKNAPREIVEAAEAVKVAADAGLDLITQAQWLLTQVQWLLIPIAILIGIAIVVLLLHGLRIYRDIKSRQKKIDTDEK